jgi:hypothetical protein
MHLAHTVYSHNKWIILLNSINHFIFVMEMSLSKGCHLDVVREPSTPHDPESDAGGSLSSWQGHPSR